MNVDMSNYLSAEYYMYYTTLWLEWVRIMMVNVMHNTLLSLIMKRNCSLVKHKCACVRCGGFSVCLFKYFWKSLQSMATMCAQNMELHVQKLCSCLGNTQFSAVCWYLRSICNIYFSHTCSINIVFVSCKFGRQKIGKRLREFSPLCHFVDSELFPPFILQLFI